MGDEWVMNGGVRVRGDALLLYLLLAAVAYLIYKVNRLEQLLGGGAQRRRTRALRGDAKVIPILRNDIPPGPFKPGRRKKREALPPPTDPD